jgi:hypothetical protein
MILTFFANNSIVLLSIASKGVRMYIQVKYGKNRRYHDSVQWGNDDSLFRGAVADRIRMIDSQIASVWKSGRPSGLVAGCMTYLPLASTSGSSRISDSVFMFLVTFFVFETVRHTSFRMSTRSSLRLRQNFFHAAYGLPELYMKRRAWKEELSIIITACDYRTTLR